MDKVKGEWEKMSKEKLHDLYFAPNNIRVIKSSGTRWAGRVARGVLAGKTEGKRQHGRPRCR
jgi:hypothetical protein